MKEKWKNFRYLKIKLRDYINKEIIVVRKNFNEKK